MGRKRDTLRSFNLRCAEIGSDDLAAAAVAASTAGGQTAFDFAEAAQSAAFRRSKRFEASRNNPAVVAGAAVAVVGKLRAEHNTDLNNVAAAALVRHNTEIVAAAWHNTGSYVADVAAAWDNTAVEFCHRCYSGWSWEKATARRHSYRSQNQPETGGCKGSCGMTTTRPRMPACARERSWPHRRPTRRRP